MKPKLFSPLINSNYCSKSVNTFFRCGVPDYDDDDEKPTDMELTTRLTPNQTSSIKEEEARLDDKLIE